MTALTRTPQPERWIAEQRLSDLGRNVAAFIVLWAAYAAVRGITVGDLTTATRNAVAIIDLQRSLGLPSEAAVQRALLDHRWLLRGANLYYIGVHFPATLLFLAWAWLRHPTHYVRIRNALVVTTGVGLVVHVVYPLKPPRMMNGFVDTAAVLGPDPYELSISGGANQLAAMPRRCRGDRARLVADHPTHAPDRAQLGQERWRSGGTSGSGPVSEARWESSIQLPSASRMNEM